MRGKGKGHRFDCLFKRLNDLTSIDNNLSENDKVNGLITLRRETSEKVAKTEYEEHDKTNLLCQCDWWLRFYQN